MWGSLSLSPEKAQIELATPLAIGVGSPLPVTSPAHAGDETRTRTAASFFMFGMSISLGSFKALDCACVGVLKADAAWLWFQHPEPDRLLMDG